MPNASAKDGTRCAGRGVWNWPRRANCCNRCGAYEPSKLPEFTPPAPTPASDDAKR